MQIAIERTDLGNVIRANGLQATRVASDLWGAGAAWLPEHQCWFIPTEAYHSVRAVVDYWNELMADGLRYWPTLGTWRASINGQDRAKVTATYLNALADRNAYEGPVGTSEETTVPDLRQAHGPQSLDEYDVGQGRMIRALRVAIEAAKRRQQPLDHVLLDGPPGLGKTTLANVIANELGARVVQTSGPALDETDMENLVAILTGLQEGDILFVDEVHRLSNAVEEYLYPAMEVFQIDRVGGQTDTAAETVQLSRFTLVGATTRPGLLSSPLRSRFGIRCHLDFYSPEQLGRIISSYAVMLGLRCEAVAVAEIAGRSRGTARIAKTLLRRVSDFALVDGDGQITHGAASKALAELGIDSAGLDSQDRQYLRTLVRVYNGGPAGVRSLASTLNVETDTLEDVVEPYLLKLGFVVRRPRGRQITDLGRRHIGAEMTGGNLGL